LTAINGNFGSPANEGLAIAAGSDTTDLVVPFAVKGFMVNVAGNLTVDFQVSGTAVPLTVVGGLVYPLAIRRIYASGLTASGITVFG